jgi:THO complex subunit 7
MEGIQLEHETKNRVMQAQKAALHEVVASISALRHIGKDAEAAEADALDDAVGDNSLEAGEEREEPSADGAKASLNLNLNLNPAAKPFIPGTPASTPGPSGVQPRVQQRLGVGLGIGRPGSAASGVPSRTASPLLTVTTPKEDDVEMGEVMETKSRKKKREEELEEGEASDGDSDSSEPSHN